MSNQNKLRKLENKRIELVRNIQLCEHYKEKITKFVQELNNQYNQGLISYKEYYHKLNRVLDQKTPEQWIKEYDSSIWYYKHSLDICEREIKKQKNITKIVPIVAVLAVFMILGFGFLFLKPTITGLIVGIGEEAYTQDINLVVNESSGYEWQPEHIGILRSARISGKILGNGSIKIYLEDKLVLDSSKLEKSGISMITGLAISDLTKTNETIALSENITEETENITAPEILEIENITNITAPEENITIAEEIETNIAIPEEIDVSENITLPEEAVPELPEENITVPVPELVEVNITEIIFTDICIETCSLNLNKTSYELRFEIENAVLYLDNISYTIRPIEIPEEVPKAVENVSKVEKITQGKAEINKPVKWTKKIILNETIGNLTVKLPKDISDVKVSKIKDKIKEEISSDKLKIKEAKQIKEYVEKKIEEPEEETELIIEDDVKEIEIEYYTKAPEVMEKEINAYKKQIVVSSDVHYENILTYTSVRESRKELIKLYWLVNDSRELVNDVSYKDTNNNGLIDRIEWIVPNLSDQTYEVIIEISKAEHLDESYNFISDIYDDVKAQDDVWSDPVYHNEYIRVTFERNITSDRDITIYARNTQQLNTRVEVYYYNSTEKITEFSIITEDKYYKVYLTNMSGSNDTFDLRIKNIDNNENAYLEFDYIVDISVWQSNNLGTFDDDTNPNPTYEIVDASGVPDFSGALTKFAVKLDVTTGKKLDEGDGIQCEHCEVSGCTSPYTVGSLTALTPDINVEGIYWINSTDPTLLGRIDHDGADSEFIHCWVIGTIGPGEDLTADIYVNFEYSPIVDTSPTIMANITKPDTVYTNTKWMFNMTATDPDNETFTSYVQFYVNDTPSVPEVSHSIDNDTNTNVANLSISEFNKGATLIAEYWAGDGIDNTTKENITQEVTVQNSVPTQPSLTYPDNDSYINSITMNWTASSDVDDDTIYYYVLVNGTEVCYTMDLNCSYIPASDSYYQWNVTPYDGEENGTTSDSRYYTYDSTNPSVSITYPTASQHIKGTILWVNGTASDTNNVTNADIIINDSKWGTTKSGTYADWYFQNTSTIADGIYSIKITANDSAGNLNSTETVSFTVDNTASTLTITTSNNTVSNSLTTIEGTALDTNEDSIYSNNTNVWDWNNTYTNWKFTNKSNIADGLYHILITANDSAGNTNSSLFAFTYDTRAPDNLTIGKNDSTIKVNDSVLFYAQWSDSLSGLSHYIFSWNNSGTMKNDSAQALTEWSNITEIVNATESSQVDWIIYANDSAGNWNSTGTQTFTIAVDNTVPVVEYVSLIMPQSVSAGTVAYISFTFNATDSDGADNLDDSTAIASFNLTGETTRTNTSCSFLAESGNTREYNCTIGIWYWDGAGDWTINASIRDINDAHAENSSTTFELQETTAMVMSPTALGWATISLTDTNKTSNTDPIVINNTANKNIAYVNVTAIGLKGAEITSDFIYANNFTVDIDTGGDACDGDACLECDGTAMVNNTAIAISGATIDKGNNSAGDGQEELYFCLKGVLQTISPQTYSATGGDSWRIEVE